MTGTLVGVFGCGRGPPPRLTGSAETHLRNVQVINRQDNDRRALVNLGGGPRPQPKTPTSVPVILHDFYGSGRHARVVSAKSNEVKGNESTPYKSDPPLTGDESRVLEVRDIPFPQLLDPIDDQPPSTVITSVTPVREGWLIRGSASDNGEIKQVTVNGVAARAVRGNFAEWETILKSNSSNPDVLSSLATDAAGNVEKLPHDAMRR